jgi:hypothetical protein
VIKATTHPMEDGMNAAVKRKYARRDHVATDLEP